MVRCAARPLDANGFMGDLVEGRCVAVARGVPRIEHKPELVHRYPVPLSAAWVSSPLGSASTQTLVVATLPLAPPIAA